MAIRISQPVDASIRVVAVKEAIEEFLADRRFRNLSPLTIQSYAERLSRLLQPYYQQALTELTEADIKVRLTSLLDGAAPATVNGYITTLKALVNWALDNDIACSLQPRRLPKLKEPKKVPPVLSLEQLKAVFAQLDVGRFGGLRDYTIYALMLDTGVRLSEAIGTTVHDVQDGILKVRGKGNKERHVALSLPMQKLLANYLRKRRAAVGSSDVDTDVLFPSRYGRALHKRTVQQTLTRCARDAGLVGIRVSPHTLRYTFATTFVRKGGSIVRLQQILGHTTLTMSRHYAAVFDTDCFEDSMRLSPLTEMKLR